MNRFIGTLLLRDVPGIHFVAEKANERVQRVVADAAVEPPHGLDEDATRQDVAGVTHQDFQ